MIEIDIAGQMIGERIENPIDVRLEGEPPGLGAKPGQQRGTRPVTGK